MIDTDFVAMLRCPFDATPLDLVDPSTVSRINEAIQAGELRDRSDQKVSETIEGGLMTRDGQYVYPIRNQIPTLVSDEAIKIPHEIASLGNATVVIQAVTPRPDA